MSKVLKDFKCKVTKRVYRAGDQYDGDRVEELLKLGYVAADEDVEPNPEEEPQEEETEEGAGNESAEKPARKRSKRDDSG